MTNSDGPLVQIPSIVERVLRQFPGLVTLTPTQFLHMINDEHALLHGEVKRWRLLCRLIDEKHRTFTQAGNSPEVVHDAVSQVIHRFFVGRLTDNHRMTAPMYLGSPADFEEDVRRWVASCQDVECMYRYLSTYLPSMLCLDGEPINLALRLKRPEIVVETADLLRLIELVRFHSDPRVRHFARAKLVLGQFCFEARKEGYEPDRLRRESVELSAFIDRCVFGGDAGEPVDVVADLDVHHPHACLQWQAVAPGRSREAGFANPVVISTRRHHIRLQDGRRIPCYFSIRSKEHAVLKAIVKDIRFLDLMGINDAIAMRFIVQTEDLDTFVRIIRGIIVPCPGQVCDQGSSIGYRAGDIPLDPKNRQSSKSYEAMKYVARICGRAVEVQIVPMPAWINAQCMHDRVNHGWYKLLKYLEEVFPILYPEHLIGVPWGDEHLHRQAIAHILVK